MSKIMTIAGFIGNKLIDLFSKKSKSGEKTQEIEEKKIDIFSKLIMWVIIIILLMCMLASLFPQLAITDWWFEKADMVLKYIFTS
ncbi:hypothetical protein [Fusobacterium mortiferum]|uniref:Uncharacterized protein n=1 Tax=Fusobacterium mortiferum TaxID=850 RepID=A0ABS2G3W6_FUSMR|nr:hypothetical protein [Fusobacterium mortiferum]MBM6876129.1 hypothetical protein [Fusobacterium mortiferum]